jgi:site-specific DNA-methyltransferase (adenine-specific)
VLDNTMGSGTTGIGCINTNRKFIGIELKDIYYKLSKRRITDHISAVSLAATAADTASPAP